MEGADSSDGAAVSRYGNGAEIYVNTNATIDSLNDSIFRSLFVTDGTADNDVEVGWTTNNGGNAGPTVYAEWVNLGVDSGSQYDTSFSLANNTSYEFQVLSRTCRIFRFKFSTFDAFNFSPTMNFDLGPILTNSEHYNSCDSLWTDMANLQYFDSSGNWSLSYNEVISLKVVLGYLR